MKLCRDAVLSVFERDYALYRGRIPRPTIVVLEVLRSLYPHEDGSLIAEIASHLNSMGLWVQKNRGKLDDWQLSDAAY